MLRWAERHIRGSGIDHCAHLSIEILCRTALVELFPRWEGQPPTGALDRHSLSIDFAQVGRIEIDEAYAVRQRRGVDVDQLRKLLCESIRDCCDHQAGVAVADEDDVGQSFVLDQVEDVGDVRVEIDLRIAQVLSFAESSERHRMDFMTVGSQRLRDGVPGPSAEPESGNQHERCH